MAVRATDFLNCMQPLPLLFVSPCRPLEKFSFCEKKVVGRLDKYRRFFDTRSVFFRAGLDLEVKMLSILALKRRYASRFSPRNDLVLKK